MDSMEEAKKRGVAVDIHDVSNEEWKVEAPWEISLDDLLDWEDGEIPRVWEIKDPKRVKHIFTKLKGHASFWWDNVFGQTNKKER